MSTQVKFFIPMFVGFIVYIFVVQFYWAPKLYRYSQDDFISNHQKICEAIETDLTRHLLAQDYGALYRSLDYQKEINKEEWINITLYDKRGKRIYPLFQQAKKRYVDNKYRLDLHDTLTHDGEYIGQLFVTLDWSKGLLHVEDRVKELEYFLGAVILLIISMSFILYYILIVTPVRHLNSVTTKMIDGDFSGLINLNRNDEFGTLCKNFDAMQCAVQVAKEELILQKDIAIAALEDEKKAKAELDIINLQLQDNVHTISQLAEEANRANALKSEFLATMSHELRTPLNSMLILSKNLEKNKLGNMTDKQVEHVKSIYDSGKSLLELINDILDLSKIEAGKVDVELMNVMVSDFTRECERIFTPIADKNRINFSILLEDDLIQSIITDPQKVNQILKNFLSNAMKFTPAGGKVLLKVTNALLYDDKNTPIKAVRFDISDTGIGISEENLTAVFSSFQQADSSISRKYGGTGLGLAISKSYTTLLNGDIFVESNVEKGSTFSLLLPINEVRRDSDLNIPKLENKIEYIYNQEDAAVSNMILVVTLDQNMILQLYKECEKETVQLIHAVDVNTASMTFSKHVPMLVVIDLYEDPDLAQFIDLLQERDDTKEIPLFLLSLNELSKWHDNPYIQFYQKPIDCSQIKKVLGMYNRSCQNFEEEKYTDKKNLLNEERKAISDNILGKKILIVDDDVRVVYSIAEELELLGAVVVKAFDGETALKIIQNSSEDIDAIFLELQLPTITEIHFIEQISSYQKNKPYLIGISDTIDDVKKNEVHNDIQAYLMKPFDREKLIYSLNNFV